MRAGRMLRGALLAGLLATGAGCTHRETPQVVTHLSDAGAEIAAPVEASRDTSPWRLRLTRL